MKSWLALALMALVCGAGGRIARAQTPGEKAESNGTQKPGADATTYDAASFEAELKRLSTLLGKKPTKEEMAALRDALPHEWKVRTAEGKYGVSTQPLRNQLTALQSEKAKQWVEMLEAEVAGYSARRRGADPQQARKELEKILSRREYASVHGPTAWERYREQLALWIGKLLYRLFGRMAGRRITGQIVFWTLLIVGVGCIGLWVFRFLVSRDRIDGLQPSNVLVASRTWQEWIRLAREAANRGDFREAVHSTYWAGIVYLEDAGMLPRDRTKTPRECLRLLKERSQSDTRVQQKAGDEAVGLRSPREPLAALTTRMERAWYAKLGANAEDFRESMNQLEALGCQLE